MIPRASFVIPAYNAVRWISQTLFSCRNQIEKKIEIIVVNDGSTDDTRIVVETHINGSDKTGPPDSRIRLFNTDNKGRSAARNFGNDQAKTELILVLDADDKATRTRVKDTLAAYQLKKADFMFGSFWSMDSSGIARGKLIASPFDPEYAKEKKMNYICHSTVAYTKKLAEAIHYEEGEWSKLGLDDWKFQWEAHKRGYKFQNIKSPLCYYRTTEDGTMATRDQKAVDAAKEAYFATA